MKKALRTLLLAFAGIFLYANTSSGAVNVQIIHNAADPTLDSIDIYIYVVAFGNTVPYQDLKFRTSTTIANVPEGLTVQVGFAPGNSASAADTFYAVSLTPKANTNYLFVLEGVRNPSNFQPNPAGRNIRFRLLSTTNVKVQSTLIGGMDFFLQNGVPDAPAMNVRLRTATGSNLLASNFSFGDTTGYNMVDSSLQIIDLYESSTNKIFATYILPANTLKGSAGTLFFSGFYDSSANQGGHKWNLYYAPFNPVNGKSIFKLQQVTTAPVQFIHNAADPNLSKVDVYVNNILMVKALTFRTATRYLDMPVYKDLKIVLAKGNSTGIGDSLYSIHASLLAGGRYVVITRGVSDTTKYAANPNGRSIQLGLSFVGGRSISQTAGMVEARIYHGVTDLEKVTVSLDSSKSVFTGGGYTSTNATFDTYSPKTSKFFVISTTQSKLMYSFLAPLTSAKDSAGIILLSGFANPSANQNGDRVRMYMVLGSGRVIDFSIILGINEPSMAATELSVFPNPASALAHVCYTLTKPASVKLEVTDLYGRLVSTVNAGQQPAGQQMFNVPMENLSKGIYFMTLTADNLSYTLKLIKE